MTRTLLYVGAPLCVDLAFHRLFPQGKHESGAAWVARLSDPEALVLQSSRGERVRFVPMIFGSLHVPSVFDVTINIDEVRAQAARIARWLPYIDGVLFVADSQLHRAWANEERLEHVLADLARAGRDPSQLPFVFQLDNRHVPYGISSLAQMEGALRTPRCVHVEAISLADYGVRRALRTLLDMIDGAAPEAPSLALDETPLADPHALFADRTRARTRDGACRERLEVTLRAFAFTLPDARLAVARDWVRDDLFELRFPAGRCDVDVAAWTAELADGTAWRSLDQRCVAVRVRARARGPRSARLEKLVTKTRGVSHAKLVFGVPEKVARADESHVAAAVYGTKPGVAVRLVSRGWWFLRHSAFAPAEEDAELVIVDAGVENEMHVWAGVDGQDRVVELVVTGDYGAALLGMAERDA